MQYLYVFLLIFILIEVVTFVWSTAWQVIDRCASDAISLRELDEDDQ